MEILHVCRVGSEFFLKRGECVKKFELPPEASVAFQLRRAHLAFLRLLTPRLARHGIRYGYYNYLRALWEKEGVTQRYLSEATSVTETTTVALLKGMARERLILRSKDKDDGRKVVVTLTEKGKALEHDLLPYAKQLNAIATRDIDPKEIEFAISVIMRIAVNLEQAFGIDKE